MQFEQPIQRWFSTSTGAVILQQIREWNGEVLKRLYGMHLMQVGMVKENLADQAVEIHHRFVMSIGCTKEQSWAVLEGTDVALPIAMESLSVVILPHVLEFSSDPHQLLREVTRVLAEDGTVVIYGFSPWSLFNLGRRLPAGGYLSSGKVVEWLALLGYETRTVRHQPWLSWNWRRSRVVCGAYQVVAKRRVAPLSPVRMQWKERAAIAGNLVNREQCDPV